MNTTKVKRRVGKYELGRTIGEGTFAKVKFARNIETGEPVAIKILDKEKVLKHKLVEQSSRLISELPISMIIFFQDDGLLHTACGTPNYVAPEVQMTILWLQCLTLLLSTSLATLYAVQMKLENIKAGRKGNLKVATEVL
ncbi:hypothetical protein BHE74_00042148 [Ensete ventricosum]|nr:hypothetical protein BHE74_00042148 [Ensete ventricosum]